MTYSQKYCLVHFIEHVEVNTQFSMSDWPLHITFADVFAIDRQATNIEEQLGARLLYSSPVQAKANRDAVLGTTPVVLLEQDTLLLDLHTKIVSLLEENGAIFNTPEFTRDGFLPHITVLNSGRLHTGDEVTIDSISLIDMFPDSDWQQRRILATFPLDRV